jgi:hypothetical protein
VGDALFSGSSHYRWHWSLYGCSAGAGHAKGGKGHRLWGNIFFRCMAIVAVTALVMAAYRPILFLALVAIFSFYAAFTA